MNFVGCEELFVDLAICGGEVVPHIKHHYVGIALKLERIQSRIGFLDIFVEAVVGFMGGQDFGDDDRSLWKFVSQILHAQLNPFGGRFDPRFGREEHIVVADHQ